MQQDGVLVINKPSGCTSNGCLQRIKRELHQKKLGHAGTLDPMVEGVLIVLLGQATKISSYIMEQGKKIYKGRLCIGVETTTWDKEGEIVQEYATSNITEKQIEEAIQEWSVIEEQEVPPISAAKFKGKSLYKWTRMGYDVPRKFKRVHIDSVEILSIDLPYATFRVACSSGTYIRSLAHSLGQRLGCGAILYDLTREYSFPFSVEESIPLETLLDYGDNFIENMKSIVEALPQFLSITVSNEESQALRLGRTIQSCMEIEEKTRAIALHDNKAIALLEYSSSIGSWKMLRGLF